MQKMTWWIVSYTPERLPSVFLHVVLWSFTLIWCQIQSCWEIIEMRRVSATKTKPPVFFLEECSEPVSLGYLAWRHFTPEAIMTSAVVLVSGILFAHCATIIRTGLWREWQEISVQKSSSSDRKSKLTVKKQDRRQKLCLISKTTVWHQCLHFRSWNKGAYDWCSPL